MGILKKLSNAAEKAERGYKSTENKVKTGYSKAKKDSEGIRRVGGKLLDWALPPPKKKQGKTKTVRKGGCICKCPKK